MSKKYFVSRPEHEYGGGGWSSVFSTRNSKVLIFATNSFTKIRWLQHLGLTLDAPVTDFRRYDYAVSVRKLVEPSIGEFRHLDKEINALNKIDLAASDYAFSHFKRQEGESNRSRYWRKKYLESEFIYKNRHNFPITREAIEFAYNNYDGMCFMLDEGWSNFMVEPITGIILPYDTMNLDWADREDMANWRSAVDKPELL